MCTCVLAWQTIELVCLHHHYEASSELKVSNARVDNGPNGHVGNSGCGVVTGVIVADGTGVTSSTAGVVAKEEVVRDLFFLRSASRLLV